MCANLGLLQKFRCAGNFFNAGGTGCQGNGDFAVQGDSASRWALKSRVERDPLKTMSILEKYLLVYVFFLRRDIDYLCLLL